MSSPMGPIGPIRLSSTEDRAEAMGCVSGCFIYVFGVVLAFVVGGLLHDRVASELACPVGRVGRMSLCPSLIPKSSARTSFGRA